MPLLRLPRLRSEGEAFPHLDSLRVIAAYGIVTLHFREFFNFGQQRQTFLDQTQGLSSFVDLFFVISGIVLSYVYLDNFTSGSFRGFIVRRFARLAPMHWATLLIFVSVTLGASLVGLKVENPEKYDWACLIPNIIMIHSMGVCPRLTFNFVSWSISAEMIVYLMFPVLVYCYRRSQWLLPVVAAVIFSTLYIWFSTGPQPWWDWTYYFGFVRAIPAFILGMVLFRYRASLARLRLGTGSVISMLVIFLIAIGCRVPGWALTPMAYLLVVVGLSADMAGKAKPFVKTFAPAGQLTYGVYMLHPIFFTFILKFGGERILKLSPEKMNVFVLVCYVLVAAAAYVSLFAFERPARRWLTRLLAGSRRVARADVTAEPSL